MAYLALYRQYRPDTFDKLIGQEHIVKTLTNQIETKRLGHAYLFTGTRGTGKTSCAKIFAKAVNCLDPINGSPCGKCSACLALSDASNIDVSEIDAASNNGVNEIRDLREKVQYPPVSCRYKVYIIDEVHMLSGAAFNALLKTLEEPPKHAIFILATTEAHKIPATILSRCMRFDFRLISTDEIASNIKRIYDEQGKEYEEEAVYAIATSGEGSMRDALSVADTAMSFAKGKLTYNDVTEILGSVNSELLSSFVNELIIGNTGNVLSVTDKLASLGKSMGVLVKDVTAFLRNLIIIKTCSDANSILRLPASKFESLRVLAEKTTKDRLIRILEIFAEVENTLKYTNHPRIVFETAAVKAGRLSDDLSFDALIARISELERKLESGEITVSNAKSQAIPQTKELETEREQVKKSVEEIGENIQGVVLSNLRKNGHEMLWNVMQSAKIVVEGNLVKVFAGSESDYDYIVKKENQSAIKESIGDVLPFTLCIEENKETKKLEAVDYETEKLKRIFGDDIVIIKD